MARSKSSRRWLDRHVSDAYVHRAQAEGFRSRAAFKLLELNERDRFFRYFDHVFNSYRLGKGKRDPTLFHDITECLALAPADILFVDDIKGNVERAQAAGWQAILYEDRASFEDALGML